MADVAIQSVFRTLSDFMISAKEAMMADNSCISLRGSSWSLFSLAPTLATVLTSRRGVNPNLEDLSKISKVNDLEPRSIMAVRLGNISIR